jgi:hypothetical protein
MAEKRRYYNNFEKAGATIVILIGAVGSLIFMFRAGHNQSSILLIAFFTIWVASPFIGLLLAYITLRNWPAVIHRSLYVLILFITTASLIIYGGGFIPPGTKPAFRFLVVPLCSWLIIATILLITRKISTKKSNSLKNESLR